MMIDRHSLRRGISLVTLGLAVTVAAGRAKAAAPPDDEPADTPRVRIRHDFKQGRLLRYRLQLSGQTAWTPPLRLADVGQMATDFTFTLHTKTLRPGGACTVDLLGERLRSAGQTPGGRIDVAAVRHHAILGLNPIQARSFRPDSVVFGRHRHSIRHCADSSRRGTFAE